MDAGEEDEVEALRAEVAARHRKLIRALVAVGVALLALAAVLLLVIDLERRPGLLVVPVGLAGFGRAAIARGLYSAWSDVDTRPDKNLIGVHDADGEDARGG
jgi:hypothetical protein